jgi:hypothetical protein
MIRQIVVAGACSRPHDALRLHFGLNRRNARETRKEAHQRGTDDNEYEGKIEEEGPDECQTREHGHQSGSQHLPSDSNCRLKHDDQDGWLESVKQHFADAGVTAGHIPVTQCHHADHARQDDESTREHAAEHAMPHPADVSGKQLRVGSRQR